MIAYASRTGTLKNLDKLRRAGWRLIIPPTEVRWPQGFRYAIDNGAWTAYTQGRPFDEIKFMGAIERLGPEADWIALPDIVAGGLASLETSLRWRDRLAGIAPLLLPIQDGMSAEDVRPLVGADLGMFIGGTSEWKERTLPLWGELAAAAGCWLHVGRVNSARRIHLCAAAGAHSFDGTSVTRYSVNLPKLDNAARQPDLWSSR
jgi:hypothetical protein